MLQYMVHFFFFLLLFLMMLPLQAYNACGSMSIQLSSNTVTNGDFQDPVLAFGQPPYITNTQYGPWLSNVIQIGHGTDYNLNWGNTQVAALDTGANQIYRQVFNLTSGKFFFTVSYAKRQGHSPSTSGIRIYWNGKNVAQEPTANDDLIHKITLTLKAKVGLNEIGIQAMGHDDGEGTTIDDVGIFPLSNSNSTANTSHDCNCQGYFSNGVNEECIQCQQIVEQCISCLFTPNISAMSSDCLNNISTGVNCTFGSFSCLKCSQGYINTGDKCINSEMYIDPNLIPSQIQLKMKRCNSFTGIVKIEIADFQQFLEIYPNNNKILVIQVNKIENKQNIYFFHLQCNYSADISNQVIQFIVKYRSKANQVKYKSSLINMLYSNTLLVFYSEEECQKAKQIQDFSTFIMVSSYIIFFLSLISMKIIGLQLIGIMQLSFFTLGSYDNVNYYLLPLLSWRNVNGYNIKFGQQNTGTPISIFNMNLSMNFISNANVMLALLILILLIGLLLFSISKNKKSIFLQKWSKIVYKQIFITFFIFSSFNFSYSLGLHFKYCSTKSSNYQMGTIAATLALFFMALSIYFLQFTDNDGLGQFKDKFKNNCVTRFYICLTILYRFVLGFFMAVFNQWYISTILVLGISISFILVNIVNLPFKKAYHNYRASLCHVTHFIILLVTNYYRSMKLNQPASSKGHLTKAAVLELVMLVLCVFFNFICLLYELIKKIKQMAVIWKVNKIECEQNHKDQFNQNNLNVTSQNMELNKGQSQQINHLN